MPVIRALAWLHGDRLRRQSLAAVLAAITLAAGVSLAVAVYVQRSSLDAAASRFGRQVAGVAPLRVVGATPRGGLGAEVVQRISNVGGVKAAVPMVQAVTVAETRTRQAAIVAFGVDCSVQALVGDLGCSPDAVSRAHDDAPPLVSPTLARQLQGGAVRTDLGRVSLTNAPVVEQLDRLNRGQVVIFPLSVAERHFARNGRVDVIYVLPADGVDAATLRQRLVTAAGPQNAVLDAATPPADSVAARPVLTLLAMVALLGLSVGALLIHSTISLSLLERRRELALSAALGAPRPLLVLGTTLEAAAVGLFSGLVGAAAGTVVARPLVASASRLTQRFLGLGIDVVVSPWVFVVGAAAGSLVAAAAASSAARKAQRWDISAELQGRAKLAEATPASGLRRAWIATSVGLAGLGACELAQRNGGLASWQPLVARVGLVVTLAGLLAGVAFFVPVVLSLARRYTRGGMLELALAELVGNARRSAAVALAVGLAVTLGAVLANMPVTIRDSSVSLTRRMVGNRVSASTIAFSDSANIDAKTPPDVVAAIGRVPGVMRVDRGVFIRTGQTSSDTIAVEADDAPRYPYRVVAGRPAREVFAHGEVLVGTVLARQRRLRPGSQLVLDAPEGQVSLRVGAVWENINAGGRVVTAPMDLVTRVWGPQPPDRVLAEPHPSVSSDELARRIRAARLDPVLRVASPDELAAEHASSITRYLAPLSALHRGLLAVALVAVASTLLLAGVQRRRELGVLAAVGLSPGGMARLKLTEGVAVGIAASLLGVAAAIPLSQAMRDGAGFAVGLRPPFRFGVEGVALDATLTLAVVAVGALIPAWRHSRLTVVEALQYE